MIKKRLIVIVLSSLALTACGGGGDKESPVSNENPIDDPVVTPVDDPVVTPDAPPKIAGTKLFSLKLNTGVVKQISTGKTIGVNVRDVESGVLLVVE